MKYAPHFTPIPWLLGWGIALFCALAFAIGFFIWAKEYKPWYTFHRWVRALIAAYYSFQGFDVLGYFISEDDITRGNFWILTLFPFWAGVTYWFVFIGYQEDIKRQNRIHKERELRPEEPAETLWSPEPIVGYRITIHSLGGEYFAGGPASCRMRDQFHEAGLAPVWDCRCGYYAMKALRNVIPYTDPGHGFAVIVLMWGKVIECEDGYRAQYMQPIGYWGRKPAIQEQMFDIVTFNGATRRVSADPDTDRCRTFHNLPMVNTHEALDALVEKAQKEFDPDAPPPYDGEYNGYRQADTED